MYLIKITHNDEIRNKFTSTKNFLSNTITTIDKKYVEKNDIRWISLETIEHSIDNKALISLRNVFNNTIKNHLDTIKSHITN